MKIAILGFGHNPPALNLELAELAGQQLAVAGHDVLVGNLQGTFAIAIESADTHGGQTMAVVDENLAQQPLPASTEIVIVDPLQKHQRIAEIADAGLVLGGAEGTRKLAAQLLAKNKPLVAVKGTGGAVDDRSLPNSIPIADSLEDAIEQLLGNFI